MNANEKAARNKKINHVVKILILTALFVCFVFPFVLVVINVFKTKADITSNPWHDGGIHGHSVPGADDSHGISVRRRSGHPESQSHADLYACGIFIVHGHFYVPRIN